MTLRKQKRRGAAVAEFAICLPILAVLILGGLECTSMVFLAQSLNIVAYEGARTASRNGSTTAEVDARCREVIRERNLRGVQLQFIPANIDNLNRGQSVRIEATAACGSNAFLPLNFFSGNLTGDAVMVRE